VLSTHLCKIGHWPHWRWPPDEAACLPLRLFYEAAFFFCSRLRLPNRADDKANDHHPGAEHIAEALHQQRGYGSQGNPSAITNESATDILRGGRPRLDRCHRNHCCLSQTTGRRDLTGRDTRHAETSDRHRVTKRFCSALRLAVNHTAGDLIPQPQSAQ
jgi:hypothetical protein